MVLEVVDGLTDNGTMIRLAAYEEGADRQLWNIADGFAATGIKSEEPGGNEEPDADIAAAQILVEDTFANASVEQALVNTAGNAKTHVESTIGGLDLNGVAFEVTEVSFAAAVAGTAQNRNGTNGYCN